MVTTPFRRALACSHRTRSRARPAPRFRVRRRPLPQAEQVADHHHPHDEPPWERKCARAILRLAAQFPGDSGAMAPFFLNYLLIAPGESFFMAANEPHAYVAG